MAYTLQKMSPERALLILQDLVDTLSDIEPEDMTTFELSILHRCTDNPPSQRHGIEWPQ